MEREGNSGTGQFDSGLWSLQCHFAFMGTLIIGILININDYLGRTKLFLYLVGYSVLIKNKIVCVSCAK